MPSLSRPTADETDSSFGGNRSDGSNVISDAQVIGEPLRTAVAINVFFN